MLVVKHTDDNKAKIADLFRPDEFKIKPAKTKVGFDLTEYCEASGELRSDKMTKAFDNLPEWQQNLIKESFEFEAAADNRSDDDDSHKQV